MADYGVQQSRTARPSNYGPTPTYQREAAFSNIFGTAPPPGRSQNTPMQETRAAPERASTMTHQSLFDAQFHAGPRPATARPQQDGYGPPMMNAYPPNPRQPNGLAQQQQQQPPPQYLPQPLNPDRRPFPQPQRVDPRQPPPQQFNRPLPNRVPMAGPALNSDAFRSRSLANMTNPSYMQAPNNYTQAPASAFRQQQYHPVGSRTTAQGRVVPERHDERAMSMTSWSGDRDHSQIQSGRVIPTRRRESGPEAAYGSTYSPESYGVPAPGSSTRASTMVGSGRTMSIASTASVSTERGDSQAPSSRANSSPNNTNAPASMKSPLVYPALLSRVAEAFLERIDAKERFKNDLSYQMAFSGKDAVDLIAYIIKTTDRNLALLLGRALDAQKFFHDVTYEHRLRDSPSELYQFKEAAMEDPSNEVNGVFTLLTECYSPTCTRDDLCYSIACPRRLEQQSRLNMKPQPILRREASTSSLHADSNEEQKLWINTVSQEVADSVSDKEKKRQEVISELMYTERDFVKDLEYLRDFWMKPLRSNQHGHQPLIPEHKREKFVRTVFGNCMEVHAVNAGLAQALTRRQQENPVVRIIGDIFLTFVPKFEPFITYGSNQLLGKWEFEKEKQENPVFAKFVDETERAKESRKLELNGYLTKPTTRLARYPLLLDNVLKHTAEDNPDIKDIPEAIAQIKGFLTKVNVASGKAENHFNLMQLARSLRWPNNDYVDLKLTEEGREIIFKGALKKGPADSSEIMVYLFDHAVLLGKQKTEKKREFISVYRRPIPLELLVIVQMDEGAKRPSSSLTLTSLASRNALNNPKAAQTAKEGFPITFKHLGKPQYEITLYAMSHAQRQKWMQHIEEQQAKVLSRNMVYSKSILSNRFFSVINRVNCLVPTDGGRKLVYGTDAGIYVSDRKPRAPDSKPRKVIDTSYVTQIDVLEEYQLLLVLANKSLVSYPLEILQPGDNQSPLLRKPRKIQNHANFFRAGVCVGRHLVCSAKTSGLSTTIKVYEPTDNMYRRARPAITQMFQSNQESLKPFKEFYIAAESSSIHFLKSKLCVACSRGFEIVSLDTLERQSLLDQADTSLDFVANARETKPIHLERLNGEFLLNYSDFSFFVNRNGWRARPEWKITWEGNPQSFALSYPYILAFEPSFIEIRNVETSACVHILTGKNIRMLHSSTREIIYAYEEETGADVVASLDFWSKAQQ